MKLADILPRDLSDSGSDCASILTSLIMAAHFERSAARQLGWRGVRPSASEHPAWTCRIANSPHVFGIRFDGEEQRAADIPCLSGYFSLFIFPQSSSPLLDIFPLSALNFALSDRYEYAVHEFSGTDPELQPFLLGQLRIDAAMTGDALALTLEAPARHRVLALDGIPANDGWLVPPGEPECDLPAFCLFLRLFAVLTATAEQQTGEQAALARGSRQRTGYGFHRGGGLEPCADETETLLTISATFGPSMALPHEKQHTIAALPLRYHPTAPQKGLPVLHVLTGFLGAGKTTFLRRWLDFLHGRERYTGVIQNEFGKVELDATLMKNDTLVEALDEGCVCCSLADSLRPGLERIISAMPARQFILETTGLANPHNILEALNGLRDIVTPGMVITIADALDLSSFSNEPALDISGIRKAQIQGADIIILNKSDAVSAGDLKKLTDRLHTLNSSALILPAAYGTVPFAELDAWMDAHEQGRLPSQKPCLFPIKEHVTHKDEHYESRTLKFTAPVPLLVLEKILQRAGEGLYRAKGIIHVENKGICIIQYAAGRLELTEAPDEQELALTIIGTNLPSINELIP